MTCLTTKWADVCKTHSTVSGEVSVPLSVLQVTAAIPAKGAHTAAVGQFWNSTCVTEAHTHKKEIIKKYISSCLKNYLLLLINWHTSLVTLPLMRSTRYSWLGVISRYWTIEFKVGIDDDFITAACLRLLMLVSGGKKEAKIYTCIVKCSWKR